MVCQRIKNWKYFIDGEHVTWKKDKKGQAGILALHPFHEPGELEEVWEFEAYLDSAIFLRERLISGDLRPLYLFWLCGATGDYNDPVETSEPPVPHGIGDFASLAADMVEFYGLDPLVFKAAGEGVPPTPSKPVDGGRSKWIASQSKHRCQELLAELLYGDTIGTKATLLAEIRSTQSGPSWPTRDMNRSYADLLEQADQLREKENAKAARKAAAKRKRDAEKAERQRQNRMKEMVKSPKEWLRESENLVEARGTKNYEAAADILVDLCEAVGGNKGRQLVSQHAAHLAEKHPTLSRMKGSLRKRGLLG